MSRVGASNHTIAAIASRSATASCCESDSSEAVGPELNAEPAPPERRPTINNIDQLYSSGAKDGTSRGGLHVTESQARDVRRMAESGGNRGE